METRDLDLKDVPELENNTQTQIQEDTIFNQHPIGVGIGCLVVGFIIGIILAKKISMQKLNEKVTNWKIEDIVLCVSTVLAIICIIGLVFTPNSQLLIGVLSFYVSFIFAWLLTKKSTKQEYEEAEEKWKKQSLRHLENTWENIGQTIEWIQDMLKNLDQDTKINNPIVVQSIIHSLKETRANIKASMGDLMSEDTNTKIHKAAENGPSSKDVPIDDLNKFKETQEKEVKMGT